MNGKTKFLICAMIVITIVACSGIAFAGTSTAPGQIKKIPKTPTPTPTPTITSTTTQTTTTQTTISTPTVTPTPAAYAFSHITNPDIVNGGACALIKDVPSVLDKTQFPLAYRLLNYESGDLVTWVSNQTKPTGLPSGEGSSIIKIGDTYYDIVTHGGIYGIDMMGLYSSTDLLTWKTVNDNIISTNGSGWEREYIANHHVWYECPSRCNSILEVPVDGKCPDNGVVIGDDLTGCTFHMLYESRAKSNGIWEVGYATTTDIFTPNSWVKSPQPAIFEPNSQSGPNKVFKVNGTYYAFTWGGISSPVLPGGMWVHETTNLSERWKLVGNGAFYTGDITDPGYGNGVYQTSDYTVIEKDNELYFLYIADPDANSNYPPAPLRLMKFNGDLAEFINAAKLGKIPSVV
jgi:hypothetical protein